MKSFIYISMSWACLVFAGFLFLRAKGETGAYFLLISACFYYMARVQIAIIKKQDEIAEIRRQISIIDNEILKPYDEMKEVLTRQGKAL